MSIYRDPPGRWASRRAHRRRPWIPTVGQNADPIGKAGCKLWLKESAAGDNTTTTSWTDDSGAGNTVTNGSSTVTHQTNEINGLAIERFPNLANGWLQKTGAAGIIAGWTLAMVFKTGSSVAGPNSLVNFGDVGNTNAVLVTVNGSRLEVYPWLGGLAAQSNITLTPNTVYRLVVTCDTSGNVLIYLDGTNVTQLAATRTFAYATPEFVVGAGRDSVSTYLELFNGDIGEVVYWDSVFSPGELVAWWAYAARWVPPSITLTVQNANHAHTTNAPRHPPTVVSFAKTTFTGNGAKNTLTSISWQPGDKITVLGLASSEFGDLPVPTIAGGPTLAAGTPIDQANACWANTWTGTASNSGTATVNSTGETGAGSWGMAVWVTRGGEGWGNRAAVADTAKTLSLVRSLAESAVIMGVADWSAAGVAGTWTPTVSNQREFANPVNYTAHVADWLDQDAAGTTSYGFSTLSTTGNLAKLVLEILGGTEIVLEQSSAPTLVVQNASHGHTAQNTVLTQVHNLTVQNASHGHTAQNTALTQVHNLTVQNASHGHTAQNTVLVRIFNLVVQNALHSHSAQNVVLVLPGALVVQNASHGHTAGNVALTQVHNLTVQNASHGHTAQNTVLTQVHNLTVQSTTHGHSAGNVVLVRIFNLVVQNALHGHTAQNVVLTLPGQLTVQGATHGHTAQNTVLTQVHNLTVQSATHGHTAQNTVLVQNKTLAMQNSAHGHTAGNAALTQVHVLQVQNSLHGHTATTISLSGATNLVVQNAMHSHSAQNVVVQRIFNLAVQNALQGHTAQNVVVQRIYNLAVQSALHGLTSGTLNLTQAHVLVMAAARHLSFAEVVTLGLGALPLIRIADGRVIERYGDGRILREPVGRVVPRGNF